MWKSVLVFFGLFGALATADAATVTLPTVTFSTAASTAITCNQTAASNLVVPVAAGTVIFTCTVAPSGWNGVVTGNLNAPFAVSGLNGNNFNIIVASQVTTAGSVAPGSVSSAP